MKMTTTAAALAAAVLSSVILTGCADQSPRDYMFTGGRTSEPPVAPDVQAGWADDNAQYNYYLGYMERFKNVTAHKLDVSGRLIFAVLDANGRPVHNCDVIFFGPDGNELARRRTYADGRCMFFPHEAGQTMGPLTVHAHIGSSAVSLADLDLSAPQPAVRELRLASARPALQQVPLDVVFVLDTTGSMGAEIKKLKQTLSAIRYQVSMMTPAPDVRFGMVIYRDRGDEYVTKTFPFTADGEKLAAALLAVEAKGGGDYPEDVQEALRAATALKWRPEAVKLAFLVADAPPHLDYADEKFTYVDFMRWAAGAGVKMTTVGASGLNDQGEYIFRQLAQYTMGLYVFLTRGEKGEASGDGAWTVSHHTGDNFETANLDAIIVRAIARELSCLSDKPVAVPEDYFQARPREGVKDDAVLERLFAECARQLVDFSQVKIEAGASAAVAPPKAEEGCTAAMAAALGDRLEAAVLARKTFKLVEREQIARLLAEIDLSTAFSGGAASAPAPALREGRQVPARYIILSKVRKTAAGVDMYVKMVRTETGEVASATMLKIDAKLLTGS